MDPMFGLPCAPETRKMNSARTRNYEQEKKLVHTVTSLDSDMRARSSKLLVEKSEAGDFLAKLDIPSTSLSRAAVDNPCLQMNRQKHAVRDAWRRITSEDVKHKSDVAQSRQVAASNSSKYGKLGSSKDRLQGGIVNTSNRPQISLEVSKPQQKPVRKRR